MEIPINCPIANIIANNPDNEETWEKIKEIMKNDVFGDPTMEKYLAFRVAHNLNKINILRHLFEIIKYPYPIWLVEQKNYTYFTRSKGRLDIINQFEKAVITGDITRFDELINHPYFPIDPLMNNGEYVRKTILNGHLQLAEHYIQICDFQDIKQSILFYACSYGKLNIVEMAIKHGADAFHIDDAPMIEAAQEGHADIIKYLISIDTGDKRSHYEVPLCAAIEEGHTSIVKMISPYLNFNICCEIPDSIKIAKKNGYTDILNILYSNGYVD